MDDPTKPFLAGFMGCAGVAAFVLMMFLLTFAACSGAFSGIGHH